MAKKNDERTNNDLQNTTQRLSNTNPLYVKVNSGVPEGYSVPAP